MSLSLPLSQSPAPLLRVLWMATTVAGVAAAAVEEEAVDSSLKL